MRGKTVLLMQPGLLADLKRLRKYRISTEKDHIELLIHAKIEKKGLETILDRSNPAKAVSLFVFV
jgi:hypothetical protein